MEFKIEAITLLFSILISIGLGKVIIPVLKNKHIGQNIRDDGPKSHLTKAGTPTMGGVIIGLVLILGIILRFKFDLPLIIVALSTFSFGVVGFIDDYTKLIMKRSLGLTEKQKIIAQIIFSVFIVILLKRYLGESFSVLKVPFTTKSIDIGIFAYFLYPFVLIGTVNAVNLTDGLDGLVSSVTIPILPLIFILTPISLISVRSFIIVLLGSILGFLVYNSNKASVFMGDTGSMILGGAIAGLALVTNTVLFLPIYGFVYVMEAGSVIIQVTSYKTRNKKRVFLMSPIHHHFELKGNNEQKIVTGFSVLSTICALIAYIAYM